MPCTWPTCRPVWYSWSGPWALNSSLLFPGFASPMFFHLVVWTLGHQLMVVLFGVGSKTLGCGGTARGSRPLGVEFWTLHWTPGPLSLSPCPLSLHLPLCLFPSALCSLCLLVCVMWMHSVICPCHLRLHLNGLKPLKTVNSKNFFPLLRFSVRCCEHTNNY